MNSLQCQDEILQMMYWMRGEHLAERITPEILNRFLRIDAAALQAALDHLVSSSLIARTADHYELTERGIVEGARRFRDEFSSVLGKEHHLSCTDPDCECQSEEFNGICRSLISP